MLLCPFFNDGFMHIQQVIVLMCCIDLLGHLSAAGLLDKITHCTNIFIDADKNICAVGYLIEQTSGREVAEQINATHQYDYLLDMHEPIIEKWAQEHGFSLE